MSAQSPALGLAEALKLVELEGLREALGLVLAEGLMEVDELGDKLADGEYEALGLIELLVDGLSEPEGDTLKLTEALGLLEAEGEVELLGEGEDDKLAEGERLVEGLRLADGELEAEGERDKEAEALGDSDAEGDSELDGLDELEGLKEAVVRPGASPYQSTPGRGPGCPSSYKNILSACSRASLGRRDLSIKVITPRFQFWRVKYCGSGDSRRRLDWTCIGMAQNPHDDPLRSLTCQGLPQLPLSLSIFILARAFSASLRASS